MPDFTPAEVELSRELKLPREFREGDWCEWIEYPTSPRMSLPALATNGMRADADYIWLPLEGDCFALLREAGVKELRTTTHFGTVEWNWLRAHVHAGRDVFADGATPREALYRLLLACGIGGKGR